MEYATHHGRDTAYSHRDRGGDGDGVLCIHGSGGSHEAWSSQLARLSKHRPVTALDLSGHGHSDDIDADPGFETLSAYADDVEAVAAETGTHVLVGNSLGGAVALHVALNRDLDLDGLVLVGTGAKLAVLEDLRVWLADDFDRAVSFLHDTDRFFHDLDDRYVVHSKDAMYACGRTVTRRDFETSHRFDVRDDLGDVDVPSLAVVGEHDQLTPPRYHEYLAEHIPDCDLAIVEDAAHLVMLERPVVFNETVDAFLEQR